MGKDQTGNKEKDNKKAARKQSHCTIGSYLPLDAPRRGTSITAALSQQEDLETAARGGFPDDF
ncbi:hypothetical protein [Massilia sp. 9096]|uniref:hypothetical protein n=1 Tax=Massilia sp. 9096 TaxID=1500894 RepID=UPI0012E06432|nr:hypothetical protein [Massilia sp. 9096]